MWNKGLSKYILCIAFLLVSGIAFAQREVKLVILHTNDTHSQVEPTSDNSRQPDMGGYARRMGLIEKIRTEEKNVLLLDAGDYWQGTPYFNFFNGRVEIDAMNRMRYDAATLGNHEFDNGIDTLSAILERADFPVVCANLNFRNTDTDLSGQIRPYHIIVKDGVKIGIFGLAINPEGLVMETGIQGVVYNDPVAAAINTSELLKKQKKCDIIICLSHLGVIENTVNDYEIAHSTLYIDIIIGGHSHSMLENVTEPNKMGKDVIIAQMGKSGLYVGRIDLLLQK